MSKQSSLLHLWGKRKQPPGDADKDQRPVRPSSSDPSPSKSAGKQDCKFQQVWLQRVILFCGRSLRTIYTKKDFADNIEQRGILRTH